MPLAVGSVLVAANVVNNRLLPDRDSAYVASCLAASASLVGLARLDGASWQQLGLDPADAARGARVGAVAAAAVAAVGAAAAGTATGRAALHDARATNRGAAGALRAALIRVPLGTVALEEVAFRSVVPAVLAPWTGRRAAAPTAAVLFGAWHILPARDLAAANASVRAIAGASRWRAVALSVGSTTIAGHLFWWLRVRSRSLVAPALLHWTVNALGYVLAIVVTRRRLEPRRQQPASGPRGAGRGARRLLRGPR